MGSILEISKMSTRKDKRKSKEEIVHEAIDFINQFYASVKREGSKTHKERIEEVVASINKMGSYELKETELCFGARTAWRNSARCIGRIQWSKLQVKKSAAQISLYHFFYHFLFFFVLNKRFSMLDMLPQLEGKF